MAAMSLLTPAESLKFESALVSYSNGIQAPEWAMYSSDPPPDELDERHLPPRREGSEQLAKATKDLISLDCSSIRWNESLDRGIIPSSFPATSPHNLQFKPHSPTSYTVPSPLQRLSSPLHQFFGGPPPHLHRPPPLTTIVPSHTFNNSVSDNQQSASSVSSDPTPPPRTPPSLKRPYTASSSDLQSLSAGPSTSNGISTSPSQHQQSKKHRASPPHQQGPVLNTKPTMLTPSQKKANHIQSEQKRRANIRRGYEALCETVPALREAIAAEERELAEGGADSESGSKGKSKKKNRGKRGLMVESGEKIDGRAGPRSENVILQKTIDYIQELLDERKVLLDRLNQARCKHAPGLVPPLQGAIPLWEREWNGGTGTMLVPLFSVSPSFPIFCFPTFHTSAQPGKIHVDVFLPAE